MSFDIKPWKILEEQAEGFVEGLIALTPNMIAAILILIIIWLLNKTVIRGYAKVLKRTHMRRSLQEALGNLASVVIWVVGILITLTVLMPNLTPSELLAGLGLGSVAVGLAFKDIFENFMAGMMILLREPMRIGDYVEVNGIEGEVRRITLRDTYLRQVDGDLVLIPNAILYKNPVYVRTDWPLRRVTVMVGVAYKEDVAQCRRIIERAMKGLEGVDESKPVEVFAQSFGESSIDFEVTWWTGSRPLDLRKSRDKVVEAVKAALDAEGIEIPFPYRTLTFDQPLPVRQMDRDAPSDEAGRLTEDQAQNDPTGSGKSS